jgi:hypothetical protein
MCLYQAERLKPVTLDELERLRRTLVSLCPAWLHACGVSTPLRGRISPVDLMRTILGRTPIRVAAYMPSATLKHWVARKIKLDFLRYETLYLGEWIVAKTEAHLYELAFQCAAAGQR